MEENKEHLDLSAGFESGKGSHSEYEREPVPQSHRKSLMTMIWIMAGFAIFSGTIWVGADIASSFGIWEMVGIAIIGNIILTIYIAFLGFLGGESGLSTHELGRKTFGKWGFYLSSSLPLLAQLGWFGVGVMMFVSPILSVAFPHLDSNAWQYQLTMWSLIIISGSLMIATAFIGVEALKWVSIVGVPLVIIFGFVMMGLAPSQDTWSIVPTDENNYSDMYAIGLVFATFSSGGTLAPDFVRWAKNGKQAVISIVVAFFICSTLMLLFGAFAFYGTGKSDLSDALYVMGLAPVAIIVLGANIWTTNDNGLYTQGLSGSSMTGIPKKYCIIALGLIATLLAPIINNNFIGFLNILNLTLPGIGTILIINGFIYKEDYSDSKVNWAAICSWCLGLIIGYVMNEYALEFILPIYVMMFTAIC